MSDTVRVERAGAAQIVTIVRPDVRNAVDPETAAGLKAAFLAGEADPDVAVHILTGADGHFCAGADLKAVAGEKPFERTGPMGPSWLELTKPSIAAVEGHAVAGGLELAIMCDLRIASESSVFGVYCRRWGVPLIDGGTVRLPRLIGQSRAMDMILTGRPVASDEALSFGLANRIVPDGGGAIGRLSPNLHAKRSPKRHGSMGFEPRRRAAIRSEDRAILAPRWRGFWRVPVR